MGCNKKDALIFYKTMKHNSTEEEDNDFLKSFCFECNRKNQCEKVA